MSDMQQFVQAYSAGSHPNARNLLPPPDPSSRPVKADAKGKKKKTSALFHPFQSKKKQKDSKVFHLSCSCTAPPSRNDFFYDLVTA